MYSSYVDKLHQSQMASNTNNVYVVLENGELYPILYHTYDAARAAALDNHADILEEERSECAEWGGMMASQVDVEEKEQFQWGGGDRGGDCIDRRSAL